MTLVRRAPALVAGVIIAAIIGAADLAGGSAPWRAAISAAIVLGYSVVVTALGARSETFSVLAGRPVDERWEHINLEATAAALGVAGAFGLLAFLVADATGGDSLPYALMCAVMGLSYFGAIAVLRLRG